MLTAPLPGTAIWVYGILANSADRGVTIFTNASFELDGLPLGNFEHVPQPEQEQYIYNVLLSSKTGLNNTEHTLMMTAMQGGNSSLLLFDYAVYTSVDSSGVRFHELIRLSCYSYDDLNKPSSTSTTTLMTSTSQTSSITTTSSSNDPFRTHHSELRRYFEIPLVLT